MPQAPPGSGSGPASPGSFKLTSDRYRGMGEAERLPSASERDTEIPEAEKAEREPDGKARKGSEIPEVGRRERKSLPEIVEDSRKLPSLTQSVGFLLSHAFSHAHHAQSAVPGLGHAQSATSRLGVAWLSGPGALRGGAAGWIRHSALLG